ncbi:phosphoglycerate mutase-like protein [Linderina pennispora]|uniref:Phosphoglycerate mutase-like protein n=1 Tax=Linderina pennispora TaxID=61395 RepID=A0A1Y1WF34_9FUNG|nr:phosphoglycerate mutase-like protein [Linderina pennispora]ORX72150.1 phosphoglycerate mutase-like protein [Linderina pennispora]
MSPSQASRAPTGDAAIPNPTKARLPQLTGEFVKKHYPSGLQVIHVDVLNRHGERTPITHKMPHVTPRNWNYCGDSNRMHADFLKAVDSHTGDGKPTAWQSYIFKSDERDVGKVFGTTESQGQHASDTSKTTAATCSFGQLTDVGRQSMSALGTHLRDLYVNTLGFLPSTLPQSHSGYAEDLYLRSTSFTRAFESLQHLLGGLYPNLPANAPTYRVNVRPANRDNMFPNFDCKNMAGHLWAGEYEQLRRDLEKIPAVREFFDTEFNPGRHRVAISTMDTLWPMRAHGMKMPEGVTDEILTRLSMMSVVEYMYSLELSPRLARMQIGPLVHELVGNLVTAVKADRDGAKAPPKMGVYSGHDTTVGPLLSVFGDRKTGPAVQAPVGLLWPPFSASIRIELLKDTKTPYPTVRPAWEDEQADHSDDLTRIAPERRVRPINVPDDLYHWTTQRIGGTATGAAQHDPRALRGYYVRVWYNDREIRLPACRDAGAHHTELGSSVCTLDGFFKQVARYVPSEEEAAQDCNLISAK